MDISSSFPISTDVLSLPEKATTLNGHEYYPNADRWRIPDSSKVLHFNFESVRSLCVNEMVQSLKKLIMWYLENMSGCSSHNYFKYFKNLLNNISDEHEPLSRIYSHHILSYHGNLPKDQEWHLGYLASFLKKWHRLGYPGIEAEVAKLLDLMTIKKNRQGWAVLTMDPEEGPFTELELHAIHRQINHAFSKGELGNRDCSLVWLFMATGARPVQIADVHVGDLYKLTASGVAKYWIKIPRAKQRSMKRRTEFKDRPLADEVGAVLEAWIAQVKDDAKTYAPETNPKDLPLFPTWQNNTGNKDFLFQTNGQSLGQLINSIFGKIKVHSHRTTEPMRITPRRFRYTLGTRAAMEKQGLLVIAELLDHSTTTCVLVYTKATPEIVEKLDEALAVVFGKISQAFAGKIVLEDFDTGRPDAPASLVRIPRLDPKEGGVGRCGTCVGCNARTPFGCYVCSHFEAWLEGPHEQVLKDLLDERRKKLDDTGDKTIAFANDHVILAVANVMDKCREIMATRRKL